MRITSFLTLLLTCTLFISAQAQKAIKRVRISGSIKNSNNSLPVLDLNQAGLFKPADPEMVIIPDSSGNFSISFPLLNTGYYRIGRNVIYLSPGDKLKVELDFREPAAAKFSGDHALEDVYLKDTPLPHAGSFLDAGNQIKSTLLATLSNIDRMSEQRLKLLNSQKFPVRFKTLETARVKADQVNSLLRLTLYYPLINQLKSDSLASFKGKYEQTVRPLINQYEKDLVDTALLDLEVFTNILPDLLEQADTSSLKVRALNDWLSAYSLTEKINKALNKSALKNLEKEIVQIRNPSYRAGLKAIYASKIKFGNGDIALNFPAEDVNGKPFNLSQCKNKVIVLDLWATWCVPCLKEMPYLKSIAESYQDNPNVVFLSLSVDYDKAQWKKRVNQATNVIALNSTSGDLMRGYSILTIPRTIIIDRDFKVAEMAGPVPSSKEFKKRIDELLQ